MVGCKNCISQVGKEWTKPSGTWRSFGVLVSNLLLRARQEGTCVGGRVWWV